VPGVLSRRSGGRRFAAFAAHFYLACLLLLAVGHLCASDPHSDDRAPFEKSLSPSVSSLIQTSRGPPQGRQPG
jgi:hypothetical protein